MAMLAICDSQHRHHHLSAALPVRWLCVPNDCAGDLARRADAAEGRGGSPAAAPGQKESVVQQQQQQQCSAAAALARLPTRGLVLGHDPIRMLFRDHWREVLLLFWFEWW